MSIKNRQIERRLEEFIHDSVSEGKILNIVELGNQISEYFRIKPAGLPTVERLSIPARSVSDPEEINDLLESVGEDLEILYEELLTQVDDLSDLFGGLEGMLEAVRTRRQQLDVEVENYLHSLFNADGYFLSIGDDFSTTDKVDLALTTAQIDPDRGDVGLPVNSQGSAKIVDTAITLQSRRVFDPQQTKAKVAVGFSIRELYPFTGAIDGLRNTAWALDISSSTARRVAVELILNLKEPADINHIDVVPFSSKPTQVLCELNDGTNFKSFGNVVTSSDAIGITDTAITTQQIRITLEKREPDYFDVNKNRWRYLVGIRDLGFYELDFEETADLVSAPLTLPDQMSGTHSIEAVSIDVDDTQPAGTSITYYVTPARIDDSPATIDELSWREITPIGTDVGEVPNVLHMGGAETVVLHARLEPLSDDEVPLIPEDRENADLSKRNPTPAIVPDTDIWRLIALTAEPLRGTITMEEGVNAIRIFHRDLDPAALNLSWWAAPNAANTQVTRKNASEKTYIELDRGYSFFYGGAVGAGQKSCYAESSLFVDQDAKITSPVRKVDDNSKTWDVRIFLNGEQVAYLPAGTDEAQVLWNLTQGSNQIVALINIPAINSAVPAPYLGSLQVMPDEITRVGTLKLGDWREVDVFDLVHNQIGEPLTFALFDNEIIARRQPAPNMRVKYLQQTGVGPQAVRLRARFTRLPDVRVSPRITGWKVRFSYE